MMSVSQALDAVHAGGVIRLKLPFQLARHPVVIAIGVVGAWRWLMWLAKAVPACFYRPKEAPYRCQATVVATVFHEDPILFRRALASWIANDPNHLIAVIDISDRRCLSVAKEFPQVQIIINPIPGKRPALAAGVEACRTGIVVLVDSDVVWERDVLEKLKKPFRDPKVGGVGARAHMIPTGDRPVLWERLADLYLDARYATEVAATTRLGAAASCLSGRTAAYRTHLLQSLKDPLLNETFLGKPCISGDDKRYTCLVLEKGYQIWHQLDARIYSTFRPDFIGFLNQRIRWMRNSFRSDLRAIGSKWLWEHPYLALVLLDKNLALCTQLNGPFFFGLAIYHRDWAAIAALAIWWNLSRAVKIWPHLKVLPVS